MKIAYLCADFGIPIQGGKGASVHVREVVAALAAQGHAVRVLSPNPGTGNALAAPLSVVPAPALPALAGRAARAVAGGRGPQLERELREVAYNGTLYRQAWRFFQRWRPDAIYERYSLFNLSGLLLARRLGVPHLLEVNAPLRLERARARGLVLAPAARLVEWSLLRGSGGVLVVSEALRRHVLAHGGREAHTVLLPNAVDTARFHPCAALADQRARLHLPLDSVVIGFAGSLKPWHGLETLLEAFALLRSSVPEARLLVAGTGPLETAIRARAAALALDDTVVFTGAVAHEEMPGILACLDIGAAPYLQVPDFYFSPLKIYEYMAAGLAVVASEAGEIASLVREGQTGLLCPPGDAAALAAALLRLARDPVLRARLGAAGRAEAERHTWAANAAVIVDMARTLSAAAARGAAPTWGRP